MKMIRPGNDLDGFFIQLKQTPHRVLLLDYDGTLAPFHVERDQALPYPGVRAMLTTMLRAHHTRIVIISGRALRDLMPLLGLAEPVELWGSHGWEHWTPGAGYQIDRWNAQITRGLAEARTWIERQGLDEQCERKPAGLALHWRGLTPAAAGALRERVGEQWTQIAQRYGIALHCFDGGIELRIPGRDKGTVVQSILDQQSSAGGSPMPAMT